MPSARSGPAGPGPLSAAASGGEPAEAAERRILKQVSRRVVPVLMLCYFVAYMDRVNLSFAAIHMNKDIHLSTAAYGLGAGLFFLAYCLFQLPSTLMLARFGPVRWVACIMLTWGLVSAGMAFVWNDISFYVMRLLLGAAEAGFLPCVLYFISDWFPASHRGRVTGLFFAGLPISGIIGSPISGWLLSLDHLEGLHGWQWLYLAEGLPAVLLAPVVFLYLQDTPAQATWLAPLDRQWLTARIAQDHSRIDADRNFSVRQAVTNPLVLFLGAVFFANACVLNSITFFLPQIIHQLGLSDVQTGWVATLPNALCLLALILIGRSSDARQERFGHTAFACGLGGGALLASILIGDPILRVACLGAAFALAASFSAPFWAIPALFLTGSARAAAISVINAIGIAGAFLAPWLVGYLRDLTGDFRMAFGGVAVVALLIASTLLVVGRHSRAARRATT